MSTPAEELPIETGFDLLAFWEEHQSKIILGAIVILLAAGGFVSFQLASVRKVNNAQAALATASSVDQLQAVIKDFQGTAAAGNASLLLAGKLRDEKKYDEAIAVLREFVDKNPAHPLAGGGALSIAATLEVQGKVDEAVQAYQDVATKYPESYAAPFALLAQANIESSKGKPSDARRSYESIVSLYPESLLAQQALQEMKMLKK